LYRQIEEYDPGKLFQSHILSEADNIGEETRPEPIDSTQSAPDQELYENAFGNQILNREKSFPAERLAWLREDTLAPKKKDLLPFNNLRTRWKTSRDNWTKGLPGIQESETYPKSTLYHDIASNITMAEMSHRIDSLTVQMTEFTDENIRQVKLLKEENSRLVQQLIDENDRLRQMIKTYHDTFMRPGVPPQPAASRPAITPLQNACPPPSRDPAGSNGERHPVLKLTPQRPAPAPPQPPALLATSLPAAPAPLRPARPPPPLPPPAVLYRGKDFDTRSSPDLPGNGRVWKGEGDNAGSFF
jgi:hypothetical protein